MKKILILICFILILSLCACNSKTQPAPTAAPTDVPTAVPTEPAAAPAEKEVEDASQKEESAAEAEPETYDPSRAGSVLKYYGAHGKEIFGSLAFLQLDTEGKKTWTAPLAGIQEFKVPESFLNAKGGIRASGGRELVAGSGIVAMNVMTSLSARHQPALSNQ